MNRFAPLLCCLLCLFVGCGGGGGGGSGGGGSLTPWAISDAANPATATEVGNLLEPGDRYRYEPDNALANAILDAIWADLIAVPTWVGSNPLYTYQFYNDFGTITNWGRAYRHTGFDEVAGPIRAFTAGTYTSASGADHPAVVLQTWDDEYAEILVQIDTGSFVHAIQHVNGLPIPERYTASADG